jgi:hypothetical protein
MISVGLRRAWQIACVLAVAGVLGGSGQASVFGGASAAAAPGTVLYRVNAGGPALTGTPGWDGDTQASPSSYVNAAATGNTTYTTTAAIDTSDPSLPAGTPAALFQDERWDDAAAPEMQWNFPVTPGSYQVRLYFAEIYPLAQAVGVRKFNVSIEGTQVLSNYDVYADVGANKGVMKSFVVSSDSTLTIDFGHVAGAEHPAIKGIEIVAASAPNTLGVLPSSLDFGSIAVGSTQTKQLQLSNLGGTGDPSITVNSAALGGTDASQFGAPFSSVTLAPGQSTTVNVSFTPSSSGSKTASLQITHTGTNTPLSVPLAGNGTTGGTVGFGKSVLAGTGSANPTSLQFGPDGRLYVGEQTGLIKVYTVTRNSANSYSATATQTISSIQSIPNHNDDGTLNASVNTRIITGILVAGTAANPIIYATSSDPRIGGGPSGTDTGLDTNSSMLSKLTWTGSTWQKIDLVRGLPRSEENHSANGLQLDAGTNTLYIAQGGNTNAGAPSNNFGLLPEFALSAAILKIDLGAIGNTTYDLPTLDDESRAGNPDANDPFGGDNGKNQAKLVPGGPVQVYAPGFRNPYDLLIANSGRMYTIDNGANAGWGDVPINEGPTGNCTNGVHEPGPTEPDALQLITGPGYYGGHPDPTRGNMANTFNSNQQSPVSSSNPVECDFRDPTVQPNITTFPGGSTNGLAEYTASNFSSAMKGDLLAASFDNTIYRVKLNSTGDGLAFKQALFSTVGSSFYGPLDVTTQGDAGNLPGTVWTGDYSNGNIYVFEPNDFSGGGSSCTGADSTTLDEDGDGYKNADEIDNQTNPCSAADVPPDWDHDFVSNLNDPDDDNDGQPDTSDPYAIDANNGTTTNLPVSYSWNNDVQSPGGLLGLGFTGLMTNGSANYESLYDPAQMTAGGAAGVMTVDSVADGDALGSANTQQYGFQFGFSTTGLGTFTAHTTILAPFAGLTPQNNQSMGVFLGKGDQDNYVKIVTSANGGAGGIQFVKEVGGVVTNRPQAAVTLPGPGSVDLYLTVDPAAGTVQPSYSVTTGGVAGVRTNLGAPEPIPAGWLTSPALAAGVISTSAGAAPPFPATWDLIEVLNGTGPTGSVGTWDTRARSGLARQEVTYVNNNGKFYLSGGGTAQQVYDPVTNAWTTVAPLPANLDHIQAVALNGLVYYIGGLLNWPSPEVNTVYIYNPATNTFSQGAPMPRGRGAGGVGVYNGKIYYAGGLNGGVAVPWFDVYDPVANAWTQLPDMPRPRDHFQAAIVGGKFYAIGGRNMAIDATTTANDAFDFAANAWQTGRAPLPTARGGFAAAALGNEILVIGGEGGGTTFHTVEAYNTVTDTWRTLAPMPTARHGIQAAVCNGGVYIADGGLTQGGGNPTDVHEVFFLNGPTTCTGAADTTPPTVGAVTPAAGATGVVAGTNVTAAFSEAMDSSTIGSSTFTLVKQGGGAVAAAVTYDPASMTATLDPGASLEAGATYVATVKGGSAGVRDLAGNALAADKVWTFTVSAAATVTVAQDAFSRTLSGGWGTADTGGAWSVVTGSAANFAVNGAKGTIVTPAGGAQQVAHLGAVSERDLDAQVEVTFPNAAPSGGIWAYLLLRRQSTGAYDRVGVFVDPLNKLFIRGQIDSGSSLFGDFDTGLAFTPGNSFVLRVQLQGASPTTVRVKAWRLGSSEPTAWSLTTTTTSGPQIAGSLGIRTVNTSTANSSLPFDNLLATRIAAADTTAPTVSVVGPADGATGVVAGTNVTAAFSEAMDASTISSSSFTLVKQGGAAVAAAVTYDSPSKTATLDPSANLEAGATYVATVKGGSAGVKDLAGNALVADKVWTFTVAATVTVTVAQDVFSRTLSGGWGTADTGGAWSVVTGSAANFAVNGTKGTIVAPSGGVEQIAHLAAVSERDLDAQVEVTFPSAVSSGGVWAYLVLRRQKNGGGANDRIGLFVDSRNKLFVRGQTNNASALFADFDTGLVFTPGNSFVLRVQVQGASPTAIRVKAWRLGGSEPTAWSLTSTTTLGPQTAGSLGIRTLNTSTTNRTLPFDNLLATRIG